MDDIEDCLRGQDGKLERFAPYLATLSRSAHSSKNTGLFAYDQEACSCKLAAKWSSGATEQMRNAAFGLLQSRLSEGDLCALQRCAQLSSSISLHDLVLS
jgi:hypothetical protein